MTVQDLYIYPVKSLGGIRIEKGKALQKGFEHDRRWMLADHSGRFITQRVDHKLALLKTEITPQGIRIINTTTGSALIIPGAASQEKLQVSVWDDTVESVHVAEEADDWFSDYLQKPVRFVFQPEGFQRPVDTKYAKANEQVSFADAFPYMLISQASLDDLNGRLAQPVPMNRFRPNIVVSGTAAFEEDTWDEIQIGEVRFKVSKPCARCVLTTVDQETGIKGKEPLYTLSSYRTVNNKVLFGQNLLALNQGFIEKGDPVKVFSSKF